MGRWFLLVMVMVVTLARASARTGNTVSVTGNGWTVTADAEQAVLTIAHDRVETVLRDVRLQLLRERALQRLKSWSVERKAENQLSIQTLQPRTGWLIELSPQALRISSTSAQAVLTARAPASKDRIVARLLDREGVPVDWVGTDEVVQSYGGSETRNRSLLPRRNPECMYFALGQVSSLNLHSLFDLRTDTAISFSDQTVMMRNSQNADLLDVTIPVPGNTLIRLIPDYYTGALGVPCYVPLDDSHFPKATVTWCSWDSYYDGVKEEDIVRNTDWIASNLKPYGFEYVQLDDGYDRGQSGEHYWIENWDPVKFSHGPHWLASYIKSKGLHPGLWLVPNAYAGAVKEHPDWYLRDKQGRIILDYNTPALDSTNPQVLDFLKKEFTILDDWGFEYYKFDGEHALTRYVPGVDHDRLYDKAIDPLVAYRRRLQLIRETIGPERFIEGCPAGTPLNGIGYFNSCFNGEDLYDSWLGMYALFSSINANAFLNHIVLYVMPGEGIDIEARVSPAQATQERYRRLLETVRTREDPLRGFGTTLAEARTVVSFLALSGVVYPVSSVLPELPEERVRLLKTTLPTMPIFPIDLFSRGTDMKWNLFKHMQPDYYIHNYPEILDLKVNALSGVYDVVGLTNWRSETISRQLSFADKLGLNPGSAYVVFDFWKQKLRGVFKDRMEEQIEPHDTSVLLIHPLLNRPQLIGNSRHITGACSILDLAWDAPRTRLRGSSETVAGENYSLFFYLPGGMTVSRIRATVTGSREISVKHEMSGNLLRISFQGQREKVDWLAEFVANARK